MRTVWLIIACSLLMGLAADAQSFDADTPIVEMGDVVIRYAEIQCIEGVRGTELCADHESGKLREKLVTPFVELGAEISGVELTAAELREIAAAQSAEEQEKNEKFVDRARCMLARALAVKRGQTPAGDCGMDDQALQLVLDQYTVNDLERVLAKDLLAELNESIRNLRLRSALYLKVYQLRGESASSFWSDLYASQVRFLHDEYRMSLEELIGSERFLAEQQW